MWNEMISKPSESETSVMGISLDSSEKVLELIRERVIQFPVYVPMELNKFKEANRMSVVPQTILTSSNGVVKRIWMGVLSEDNLREVEAAISNSKNTH